MIVELEPDNESGESSAQATNAIQSGSRRAFSMRRRPDMASTGYDPAARVLFSAADAPDRITVARVGPG